MCYLLLDYQSNGPHASEQAMSHLSQALPWKLPIQVGQYKRCVYLPTVSLDSVGLFAQIIHLLAGQAIQAGVSVGLTVEAGSQLPPLL